ncbi:unnamed protein product [Acidithrix sp. C25]|nr:unnamed protein product [Acidithrix sp. C25]
MVSSFDEHEPQASPRLSAIEIPLFLAPDSTEVINQQLISSL